MLPVWLWALPLFLKSGVFSEPEATTIASLNPESVTTVFEETSTTATLTTVPATTMSSIEVPPLAFVHAVTNYKWSHVADDMQTIKLLPAHDDLLLVAVSASLALGSSKLKYRLVEEQFSQVVLIDNATFTTLNSSVPLPEGNGFLSPEFGSLTMVGNVYAKQFAPTANLTADDSVLAVVNRTNVLQEKETLIGVTLSVRDGRAELAAKRVSVVPFAECEAVFDPERLQILDEEDQFCTDSVSPTPLSVKGRGNVNGLLFRTLVDGRFELVGVESFVVGSLSLSSMMATHCGFIDAVAKEKICL